MALGWSGFLMVSILQKYIKSGTRLFVYVSDIEYLKKQHKPYTKRTGYKVSIHTSATTCSLNVSSFNCFGTLSSPSSHIQIPSLICQFFVSNTH